MKLKGTLLVAICLFGLFTSTAAALVLSGVVDPTEVRASLESARGSGEHAGWAFLAVVGLLTIDLLLPVPSTAVMVVSGYLLGAGVGATASSLGAMAAGALGYEACRQPWGARLYRWAVSPEEEARFGRLFAEWGAAAILVARLFPMAPEVLACLAGLSRLPRGVFYARLALGTLPYALVCGVAGAMSSFENPWPLVAVLGLPVLLGALGRLARRPASRRPRAFVAE